MEGETLETLIKRSGRVEVKFALEIAAMIAAGLDLWRLALKVCRRVGFKPRIVKEADGAPSALAFVAAGYGLAVVSEPLQKIPAKDVIFRDLGPEDRAWMPVGAAWKPDSLTAPAASKFIDVLAQICSNGNGEPGIWNVPDAFTTMNWSKALPKLRPTYAQVSHRYAAAQKVIGDPAKLIVVDE